jgi:AraC-like DNA-binding protein
MWNRFMDHWYPRDPVTVSALTDILNASAANVVLARMREMPTVRAGTYPFDAHDLATGWHAHDLHQVEYAFEGTAEVTTPHGRYLLPPQQAIWIPAGLVHQTTLRRVRSVSVFFDPEMLPGTGDRARVLAAAPVVREMILHATRWPIGRGATDPEADRYFEVLAALVREWLDHEVPLCLPVSDDALVTAAMTYTSDHLATVTEREMCASLGISPRTLRRRFAAGVGMTWRHYVASSRVLRAMARLAESDEPVTGVALRVGFESVASFSRAFKEVAGETPSTYRARTRRR